MSERKIFLSYRRSDSPSSAGRLYDALSREFGPHRTFMDVDDIPVGVDFVNYLNGIVAQSSIMLVLIGPRWIGDGGGEGRRIDDPNDFVRLEIEAALSRDIPVVPVLVEDVAFPAFADFPESLRPLARRQAIVLRHDSWTTDSGRLIEHLSSLLEEAAPPIMPNQRAASRSSWSPQFFWTPIIVLGLAFKRGFEWIGDWISKQGWSGLESKEQSFDEADALPSADIGDVFRSNRGNGSDLTDVMTRLEAVNIEMLRGSRNVTALEDHLRHFGKGVTKSIALAELEYALWSTALEQQTPKAVLAYLARFPNGAHAEEARRTLETFDATGELNNQLPRIFVNYRRIDSQDSADRILEKLVQWVPKRNVMIDVDRNSITPGLPIRPQLESLVRSCDVMLVLIHNRWVTEFTDRADKHFSGESPDFVRIEIEAALERKDEMPIVPLLLGDTQNPLPEKLPLEIRAVMQRSWHRVSRDSFDDDMASLIRQMSNYIDRTSAKATKLGR